MRIRARGGDLMPPFMPDPMDCAGQRQSYGSGACASIPLKAGRQVIRLDFENGSPVETVLEVAR